MHGEWGQIARLLVKVVKKVKIKARGCEVRQQSLNPLSIRYYGESAQCISPGQKQLLNRENLGQIIPSWGWGALKKPCSVREERVVHPASVSYRVLVTSMLGYINLDFGYPFPSEF